MPPKKDDLGAAMGACYHDPALFVQTVFPWGEDGPLKEHDGPDVWQSDQLGRIKKSLSEKPLGTVREAVSSGHGIGKSAQVAWLILWFMCTRVHANGVVTANTKTQLETKTWRELAVWHNMLKFGLKDWFNWTATSFKHTSHPATWYVNAVPNTEHNSEAFAGLHANHVALFYDEASSIGDKIWEVSMGAMTTDRAMWFVYGNPTRNSGWFRDCFGSKAHRWSTAQVDSRDCKMTNKVELKEWEDDYGEDSDFFRVRVKGVFPRASDSQFIPIDIVNAAMKRDIPPASYRQYPKVLGVDVARFGTNRSVVIRRQGPKVWEPKSFVGIDLMEFAGIILDEARNFGTRTIFVDGTGVGGGVVDRLRQIGLEVIDVQFGRQARDRRSYANLRAELWGAMKDWLGGEVDIPDRRTMETDLIGPQYGLNARLQIQLESKQDMLRRGVASPDEAEAVVTTFAEFSSTLWQPKARRISVQSASGWT